VPRYHILRPSETKRHTQTQRERERERERAMSKNWCFYKP
jgi:hypothetical protein